jgi:hypothetical protein
VEGDRLANTKQAADETIADGELPPLDATAREKLGTLLQLHGTFMMATVEGIEAITAEERYQRTAQEEVEFRAAAVEFGQSLQCVPDAIDTRAAAFVLGVAEETGKGSYPERSGVVGTGAVKNVAITLSAVATLGTLPLLAAWTGSSIAAVASAAALLVGGDGLRKSKPFLAVAGLVTKRLDKASEIEIGEELLNLKKRLTPQLRFVLKIEPQLRRLAHRHKQLEWLNASLDWIKRYTSKDE